MENFSAAITFMRANPPTTGHFLIVDTLHNLPVDKKYIYLSHSQDKKKNPLPYFEKYSFIKTFVEEKYDDIEVVNSEARTLIDALYEVNSKGCNNITIVLGSDRIEEFSALVYKYNGQISKKTGEIIYQFDNINFVQAGEDRDENSSDELSAISATKQRTLAAEGNFEEFSKGVPTADPYLKKELYDLLREYMGIETLKEGIFDKVRNIFDKEEPIAKYYKVGPILKMWWLRDETGVHIIMPDQPFRYDPQWMPVPAEDYIGAYIYLVSDFSEEIRKNIIPVEKPDKILGEIGAKITDAYTEPIGKYRGFFIVVKVIFRNEKAYEKINEKIKKELITIFSPDDYYNKNKDIFGDKFTIYNMTRYFEMPTAEDLEKEGFDFEHRVEELPNYQEK